MSLFKNINTETQDSDMAYKGAGKKGNGATEAYATGGRGCALLLFCCVNTVFSEEYESSVIL